MHIPNDRRIEFSGGEIGILFVGNFESSSQLAQSLNDGGLSVLAQNKLQKISYEFAEIELLHLKQRCSKIYLLSFFDGATPALELAQNYSSEIAGLILVEPKLSSNPLSRSARQVKNHLYLIDQPSLFLYPIANDDSLVIADEISSPFIREVVMDYSLKSSQSELPLLIEETLSFIKETQDDNWSSNDPSGDSELIDAEFQSIVAGLSLDQSTPNTFLDQLESSVDEDHFEIPDPALLPIKDRSKRNALFFMTCGPIYALIARVTGFNPFGIEPWPGILALIGGLAYFLYSTRDDFTDDDGAVV